MALFTEEQRGLVEGGLSDVLADAGPGSGKSRAIAGLIGSALLRDGVSPSEIVAITYTQSAAASLDERIAEVVTVMAGGGMVLGMPDLKVGTIHSLCSYLLRLTKRECRKFRVIPDGERNAVVRAYAPKLRFDLIERRQGVWDGTGAGKRGRPDTPSFTDHPFDRKTFLRAADIAREECVSAEHLPPGFAAVLQKYRAVLKARAIWDYSEVLVAAHDALHDTTDADSLALQHHVAQSLRLVVCDEIQDVNRVIAAILRRLRELGVVVAGVGDADQQIMSYRGASSKAFTDFLTFRSESRPPARRVLLTKNWRSSEGIVAAPTKFITGEIKDRAAKMLTSAGTQVWEQGDMAALLFPAIDLQDAWAVQRLRRMHGTPYRDRPDDPIRGLFWRDMAVLARTNESARRVAARLNAGGVPAELAGQENLLQSKEALATASLYFFLGGLNDSSAVKQAWGEANIGASAAGVSRAINILTAARLRSDADGPICLIATLYAALAALGFHEEAIPVNEEAEGRQGVVMCNVARIARAAQAYQSVYFRLAPSRKFPDFAGWLRDEAEDAFDDDFVPRVGGTANDAVQVMTMHRAKGLEFPLVWLPDLWQGYSGFPSPPRASEVWQALSRGPIPEAWRYDSQAEDDVRLLYTAMTRPAKYLFATYGNPPQRFNKRGVPMAIPQPSPYLKGFRESPWFVTDPAVLPPSTAGSERHEACFQKGRTIELAFSDLGVHNLCPRQAKLRFIYGFPPPVVEDMGFGDALHRGCTEAHERAEKGELLDEPHLVELLQRHYWLPFASTMKREQLFPVALSFLSGYLRQYGIGDPARRAVAERVEKDVAYSLDVAVDTDGDVPVRVRFVGRDDLVISDGEERTVEDWKTSSPAVARDPELLVVRAYALAEESGHGRRVDGVATRVLDGGKTPRQYIPLGAELREATQSEIARAARAFATLNLPMDPRDKDETCRESCDPHGVCGRYQAIKEMPHRFDKGRGE